MTSSTFDSASERAGGQTGKRLESWKEIASYLKRTVRTVHRWEKDEGLPVHRHLHRKQGTVYAYASEIDAWWEDRSVALGSAAVGWRKRRLAALSALAIATLLLAAYFLVSSFTPRRPAAAPIPDSIAVLPFRAPDAGGSDDRLGYGIAEEVLDRLAEVRSFTVIARTSAFAFDEQPIDPVEIADRLGVKYVLDGSVQRDGEMLRVRARLLDRSGRQLWSKSFDRTARSLFDVQDEIAAAVVATIAPQLGRLDGSDDRPNADAYQYYLLGREHLSRWALDAASAAFEHAIDLDPQFARPYGGLAMVRALQTGLVHGEVSPGEAREAAEHALNLDPELADAHAAAGRIAHAAGQLAQAESSLQRALQIDPNLVDARLWLSANLLEQERYLESEQELEKALDVDPLHAELNASLADLHWSRGDYQGAQGRYLRILDLPEPPRWAYERLVLLNRDFGQLEEALKWAKRGALAYADKDDLTGLDGVVLTYNRLGMVEDAERWLERLRMAQGSPWLGVSSEFLYTQGRFAEVHALNMEHLKKTGRPLRELPFLMQEVVGGFQVLTGRYAEGIAVLETLFADTFRIPEGLPSPGHRGDFELMFAQFLAYGYRQTGREEAAGRVLDRIHDHIQNLRRAGIGNWPNLFVAEARNYAMRGQKSAALAALRQAVNKGWRDYVFERHNPCWDTLRDEAEYRSLLALVESDVAAQREHVEARGRDEEFEARTLAALGHVNSGAASDPARKSDRL